MPHLDGLARAFARTRRVFASQPSRGHGMTGKALKSPVVDQICHSAPGRWEAELGGRRAPHPRPLSRTGEGGRELPLRVEIQNPN